MTDAPHNINTTPMYRVRQANDTEDENRINEVRCLLIRYESAKTRLRSTKHTNKISDQAITEMLNSGGENKNINNAATARPLKCERCLNDISPPMNNIRPKVRAFKTGATLNGSLLKSAPINPRSAGYNGGHEMKGSPPYPMHPFPAGILRAVPMYSTESWFIPIPN
jgi:hypothetical protein